MAKTLLLLVVTVLAISAVTEAFFSFGCPPNCRDTWCSSSGCVTCNPGYCLYISRRHRVSICVRQCPKGYYCYEGVLSVCTKNRN